MMGEYLENNLKCEAPCPKDYRFKAVSIEHDLLPLDVFVCRVNEASEGMTDPHVVFSLYEEQACVIGWVALTAKELAMREVSRQRTREKAKKARQAKIGKLRKQAKTYGMELVEKGK